MKSKKKNNRSKYVVKFASKRTGDEICKAIWTSAKMGSAMLLTSSSQLIQFPAMAGYYFESLHYACKHILSLTLISA